MKTTHGSTTCKAQTGRNTLSHLQYYKAVNIFMPASKANIHDVINARSMNITPNLKPFQPCNL